MRRMHELLVPYQQPLAKDLAQNMSIKIIGYKYARKEVGTIYTKKKFLEEIQMNHNFSIISYRIDLYFPEHKSAIYCHEYNHKE